MKSKPKVTKKVIAVIVAIFFALIIVFIIVRAFYLHNCTIQSEEDAIAIAEAAFMATYGESSMKMSLIATHNIWNGTWYVRESFPLIIEELEEYTITTARGIPHAVIREWDGEIIRMWHDR